MINDYLYRYVIFVASGGLFGGNKSVFGGTTARTGFVVTGTAGVKFTPVDGTDSVARNGVSSVVRTKHYCINGMKQYEDKSLEVGHATYS